MKNLEQPIAPCILPPFMNGGKDDPMPFKGLTKREYFAAMAMQGLCQGYFDKQNDIRPAEIAEASVFIADALLNELEK